MQSYAIVVFCICSLFTTFDLVKIRTQLKLAPWILLFVLLLIMAAARTLESDTQNYHSAFESAPNFSEKDLLEPGFTFLINLFKSIGFNAYYFFALFTLASMLLVFRFFYNYTPYFFLATLIYLSHVFILREMLQIRAGMSIAISMFAIPSIHNRRFWQTFLILLLASTLHIVASAFFVLYFLYPFFKTIRSYIFLLAAGLILGVFLDMNFFAAVAERFGLSKVIIYAIDDRFTQGLGLLNPVLIKHFLLLIFLFVYADVLEAKIPYFRVLLFSYVIAAFWLATFNAFDIVAGRVATIFSNVEHVLIPSLLFIPNRKIIVYIGILSYCIVAFIANYRNTISLYDFDLRWIW